LKSLCGCATLATVPSERKARWKQIVILFLVLIVVFLLLPLLAQLLGFAVGLSFLAVEIIGILIFVVGIPLFFLVMSEAGYRVFLRPFMRALHIRKIRNRRLLFEAATRDGAEPK
jgi:hypothetical protein